MAQMEVKLIDHMGSDLSVVNAARVSFSKESHWEEKDFDTIKEAREFGEVDYEYICSDQWLGGYPAKRLSKADAGLIRFLARGCSSGDWEDLLDTFRYGADGMSGAKLTELVNHIRKMPTHWTPFAHTAISLRIKAPIFIARQYGKHQAGLVWNEVSRRYVDSEPEFYLPDAWRERAANMKQGSSEECVEDLFPIHEKPDLYGYGASPDHHYRQACKDAYELYRMMLDNGVCPEQARMVLPQSMMTEWIWTGNLYSFANVFIQRTNSHAQKEAQDLAHMIGDVIKPLFPVSWKALTK